MDKENNTEYWQLIARLRAIYKPPSVAFRIRAVREILKMENLRGSELAKLIGCSTGHAHQLMFLAEKSTDEDLKAFENPEIYVGQAYYKIRNNYP